MAELEEAWEQTAEKAMLELGQAEPALMLSEIMAEKADLAKLVEMPFENEAQGGIGGYGGIGGNGGDYPVTGNAGTGGVGSKAVTAAMLWSKC